MSERKYAQMIANARRWRLSGLGSQPEDVALLQRAARNRQRSRQLSAALTGLPATPGLNGAQAAAADDDVIVILAATRRDAELLKRQAAALLRGLSRTVRWARRVEIQVQNG